MKSVTTREPRSNGNNVVECHLAKGAGSLVQSRHVLWCWVSDCAICGFLHEWWADNHRVQCVVSCDTTPSGPKRHRWWVADCPILRHSNAPRHKGPSPVVECLHRWSIHSDSSWWIPALGNRHSKRSKCCRWSTHTPPGPFSQGGCNCVPMLRILCRWIGRRRHIPACLALGSIWRGPRGIGRSSGCSC